MDIKDHPKSFGVFKPVDHIVAAFASQADLEGAAGALRARGFDDAEMTRYTPEQMLAQADDNLKTASPVAAIGQDLNLVKAHRALAAKGCPFLVVHAPKDEQAQIVTEVIRAHGARAAQRYGGFIIEELIEEADEQQVFESPDKGLDLEAAEHKVR